MLADFALKGALLNDNKGAATQFKAHFKSLRVCNMLFLCIIFELEKNA